MLLKIRYRFCLPNLSRMIHKYYTQQQSSKQELVKNTFAIFESKNTQSFKEDFNKLINNIIHKQNKKLVLSQSQLQQSTSTKILLSIIQNREVIQRQTFYKFLKKLLTEIKKTEQLTIQQMNILHSLPINFNILNLYRLNLNVLDFQNLTRKKLMQIKIILEMQINRKQFDKHHLMNLLFVTENMKMLRRQENQYILYALWKKIYLNFDLKYMTQQNKITFIRLFSKSNFSFPELKNQVTSLVNDIIKVRNIQDYRKLIALIRSGLNLKIKNIEYMINIIVPLILFKVNQQPSLMVNLALIFIRNGIHNLEFWNFYFKHIQLYLIPKNCYYIYTIDYYFRYNKKISQHQRSNFINAISNNQNYKEYSAQQFHKQRFHEQYINKYSAARFQRQSTPLFLAQFAKFNINCQTNIFDGICYIDFYLPESKTAILIFQNYRFLKFIENEQYEITKTFQLQLQMLHQKGITTKIIQKMPTQQMIVELRNFLSKSNQISQSA